MARGIQSRGTCMFCGYETTKGSMGRHLATCPKRQELLAANETKHQAPVELYHLRAQDAYDNRFWLDFEMRGSAKLADIDSYLRAIWLECCGHLSEFSIGRWGGTKLAKTRRIEEAFRNGAVVTHIYDFGTSSETQLKLVSQRNGASLTKHPILLLARNQMPEATCIVCDEQATYFCEECVIEEHTAGTLCPTHAKSHPHDNYGPPIKIVNSPRLGMCGYDGPAEPPY